MLLQQSGRPIESKPPLAPAAAHGSLRQPDLATAADVNGPADNLCPVEPAAGASGMPAGSAPPAAAPAAPAQQAPLARPPIGRHASGGNMATAAAAGASRRQQPSHVATVPAQHGSTQLCPADGQVGPTSPVTKHALCQNFGRS